MKILINSRIIKNDEITIDYGFHGFKVPINSIAVYGSRAIIEGKGKDQVVSFVHDRESYAGNDNGEIEALAKWARSEVILRQKEFDKSSDEVIEFTVRAGETVFKMSASPNASYGYLYLTAFSERYKPDAK